MNHYRQKRNECALAAVCMVMGLDYEEMSERYEGAHGCPFGFDVVRSRQIALEAILQSDIRWFTSRDLMCAGTNPDLAGRGILTISICGGRHAVAYEDGVIYDPERPGPEPFEEWWSGRRGRDPDVTIDGIKPVL